MLEEISTEGPIHIYSRVLLKFHASHGTAQLTKPSTHVIAVDTWPP